MKTTGADLATIIRVPEGATLERAYWAIPDGYSPGPQFSDQESALRTAIDTTQAAVDNHNANYPSVNTRVPLPETITIDLRWNLIYPQGGGLDTIMSRITYSDIADAQAHLDRIDQYAH